MSQHSDAACNPFSRKSTSAVNYSANTITMMALGLFFTFVSLFVISFTSRKEEEDNITTKLNQAMMDDESKPKEKMENIEELGVKKNAREMHVFAVTPATVHF